MVRWPKRTCASEITKIIEKFIQSGRTRGRRAHRRARVRRATLGVAEPPLDTTGAMADDGPPNKKVCVKNESGSEDESGSDDDKDEDFARPMVDIDAIASAKSLGDAMRILAPQLEGLPRRPRGKYGKRKNLTPEEKAELTRRRNRENASSTRKRRKMYIKYLQEVAETLKSRQDALAKMAHPRMERDIQAKRREAVQKFFEFRSNGVVDLTTWVTVIDAAFRLTLPVTPYQNYPSSEVRGSLRVVEGASALVADTAGLHAMLQTVAVKCHGEPDAAAGEAAASSVAAGKATRGAAASGSAADASGSTSLQYEIDPQSIILMHDKLMCQWNLRMTFRGGSASAAAPRQINVAGMAKCCFNAEHKLTAIDLRFDVMGLTQLLEQATGAAAVAGAAVASSASF